MSAPENNIADIPTGTVIEFPDANKKGRGRPKGSRNKVSKDAKELMARHAPAAIRALCRFAAGASVEVRDGTGTRVLTPDVNQMLQAERILVDRLVPTLKAQEVSGPGGTSINPVSLHFSADDHALCFGRPDTDRDMARRMAFILAKGGMALDGTDKPVEGVGSVAPRDGHGTHSPPASASPKSELPPLPPRLGDVLPIAGTQATIRFAQETEDGQQRWDVHQKGMLMFTAWGRENAESWARAKLKQ